MKRHVSITRFVIEKTALFTVLLLPFLPNSASANPYLAKPGEAPATLYIASCAVTGGFTHLYVALDYDLFAKYGLNVKHVVIRGGTNISIAALSADEIQFLYCAGESTLPVMASGGVEKLQKRLAPWKETERAL